MKIILAFLSIFILYISVKAQVKTVIINVKVYNIQNVDSVFITGNVEQLGYWKSDAIVLERISDSVFQKTFKFEYNSLIEFKFTRGNWNLEALDKSGNIPLNNSLLVKNDTTIYIQILNWKDFVEFESTITGTIHTYSNWEYEGLLPRDVLVWLPDIYFTDTTRYFPVIYAHDGQNLFDRNTASFGNEWRFDEIAESLITSKSIKPLIVVGLYSTEQRQQEYSYLPIGQKYIEFIINEVKPFVDKNYRTLPDRNNTATLGASMGGLISFIMVWEYDDIFSKAACFSPAFKIRDLDYVKVIENENKVKKDISLYIDNGDIGIEAELQPGIDDMFGLLKNRGYELGKRVTWYLDENAEHNEMAWSKRLWRPLINFFGK